MIIIIISSSSSSGYSTVSADALATHASRLSSGTQWGIAGQSMARSYGWNGFYSTKRIPAIPSCWQTRVQGSDFPAYAMDCFFQSVTGFSSSSESEPCGCSCPYKEFRSGSSAVSSSQITLSRTDLHNQNYIYLYSNINLFYLNYLLKCIYLI